MIDMKLTRCYFDVKDVRFGDACALENGVLTISKDELRALTQDLCKAVKSVDFELTQPGENARIIHVLDTLQPMLKVEGEGAQYSGFFSTPYTVGRGRTNLLRGFAVMESAALPWDDANASSGLLYPRDAIV
ncbi:MAG: glycine/sarcosine/betaine reductase component B subunit, partial [Ruthenibacterium sp.]